MQRSLLRTAVALPVIAALHVTLKVFGVLDDIQMALEDSP
jgi:hypothetical protein